MGRAFVSRVLDHLKAHPEGQTVDETSLALTGTTGHGTKERTATYSALVELEDVGLAKRKRGVGYKNHLWLAVPEEA